MLHIVSVPAHFYTMNLTWNPTIYQRAIKHKLLLKTWKPQIQDKKIFKILQKSGFPFYFSIAIKNVLHKVRAVCPLQLQIWQQELRLESWDSATDVPEQSLYLNHIQISLDKFPSPKPIKTWEAGTNTHIRLAASSGRDGLPLKIVAQTSCRHRNTHINPNLPQRTGTSAGAGTTALRDSRGRMKALKGTAIQTEGKSQRHRHRHLT